MKQRITHTLLALLGLTGNTSQARGEVDLTPPSTEKFPEGFLSRYNGKEKMISTQINLSNQDTKKIALLKSGNLHLINKDAGLRQWLDNKFIVSVEPTPLSNGTNSVQFKVHLMKSGLNSIRKHTKGMDFNEPNLDRRLLKKVIMYIYMRAHRFLKEDITKHCGVDRGTFTVFLINYQGCVPTLLEDIVRLQLQDQAKKSLF